MATPWTPPHSIMASRSRLLLMIRINDIMDDFRQRFARHENNTTSTNNFILTVFITHHISASHNKLNQDHIYSSILVKKNRFFSSCAST